jgi:hypothetical protein
MAEEQLIERGKILEEENLALLRRAKRAEAAADALATLVKRIYSMVYEGLRRDDGCAFCGPAAGFYLDGEYWHDKNCPFEEIEAALQQYQEACND